MRTRVQEALRDRELISPGDRVVVAVSGGADSVALLLVLRELADLWPMSLTVAHLHHGVRAAADEDQAFVEELARSLGVPVVVERLPPGRLGPKWSEAAARAERYRFLERVADAVGAQRIAVGHTRDDAAETVLLHLFRGQGPGSLAGIPWRRGRVVRPLLGVGRADVEAYLRARGQAWREDETNRDVRFLRARIRHELLPLLQARYDPAIRAHLVELAERVAAEEEWLAPLVAQAWRERVQEGPLGERLLKLQGAPLALQRRLLLQALPAPGGGAVEAILRLARGGRGEVLLPGGGVARPAGPGRVALLPGGPAALPVPGKVRVGDWVVASRWEPERRLPAGAEEAACDARVLEAGSLTVRTWRPGDRMRPLGLGGTRRLQDVFVDAKVPRGERRRRPVVVDAAGDVVWVAGVRRGEAGRVTDNTPLPLLWLSAWREPWPPVVREGHLC